MRYHNDRPVSYYTFASFDAHPGLKHAVLTRRGGVSPAPWDSLNLGWTVGDPQENIEANYELWSQAFGLKRADLTTTWQVHGKHIILTDAENRNGSLGKADGLVTKTAGIPLVQRFADCTPIFLYDPVRHACGIAHAGWQGTVNRCAEAAVQAMQRHFGSEPADLLGGIGPAIGPCCYEVGLEVADAIRQTQTDPDRLLRPGPRPASFYLDLWEANAVQLRDAGVRQIEVAELCTSCHRDTFFSHRGDKGKSGRFGAFIVLESR
ncbi:MAG: peptidoglycan editing factor PgeF [Caldilineales bacterium]|nr:peptidoglycan editing factor PgeF [Caldilineales bacterium]